MGKEIMSDSEEIPENFIDILRFKVAMGWVSEHEALLKEVDRLTDMLIRALEYVERESTIEINESDIYEWWKNNKDKKC